MKKVLFILAATALFASCASDETATQDATPKTEETTPAPAPAPAPAPEASQAPAPADTAKKAVDQKADEMKKADEKAADQKAK